MIAATSYARAGSGKTVVPEEYQNLYEFEGKAISLATVGHVESAMG
jgi:hypothetical protein